MNVCMLAYAHYINDARIKSYVRTLESQGHRVDVIALRSEGESSREERAAGATFRIMNKYQGSSALAYAFSYLRFFLKSFAFLTWRMLRSRYDAVHVHNMPNFLVFAAAAPKLLGAKVLLDVHDLMTVNYMAKFELAEAAWPIRLLKAEQKVSAFFADAVICADHNQRDYLMSACKIAGEKVTVLMNLPNIDLFSHPAKSPLASAGRDPAPPSERGTSADLGAGRASVALRSAPKDGVFRIVYHGTIAHRLGIDLMIKAMAIVSKKVPAQLWIYGAGDFLPDALALASQLRLNGVVRFSKSFFPVERIAEMVSPMDLGLIGNRRNLACDEFMLPVKLLEYVYIGIPVIVPRLKVIGRYFDDSSVRFYEPENVAEMAEAIVSLYHDREERMRLARTASAFYDRYNIRAQGERYLNLIAPGSRGVPASPEKQAV